MSFNNWKEVKLGDIVDIISGGTPKTSITEYWEPQEIDWITAKDVSNCQHRTIYNTERKISKVGLENSSARILEPLTTVLIARGATTGKVALTSTPMAMNQTCYGLQAKQGVDQLFIYYLMLSRYNSFKAIANGSVFETVIGSGVKTITVKIPNFHYQVSIGKILGMIDDKIELNQQIISNLEQFLQALFKHWFIDFDFPNQDTLPYKSSGGKMVESELGEIPEGWHVGMAKEIFDFSPTVKVKKGEVIPYVEMRNLKSSAMIYEWTDREFSGSGSKFRQGDTLLARITPCLENGKIGYVDFLKVNEIGWGSTEFIIIRSKPGIKNSFSYFFASESKFKDYAVSNMNGSSGRQRVKAETLADYKMIIPPKEIINKYTEITEKNMNFMSNLKMQILNLQKLRDSLLPKLLSGEIEIPDESVID